MISHLVVLGLGIVTGLYAPAVYEKVKALFVKDVKAAASAVEKKV